MPIPEPREGEEQSEFISRCVEAIAGEYDDVKQAVAICYTTWERAKNPTVKEETGKSDCGCSKEDSDLNFVSIITKSDDRFIIGGYANVYMLDADGKVVPDYDNEVVSLEALDEALKVMMKRVSRRNLMLYHSNVQIGEIIHEYTDSEGVTWKTHVVHEPHDQYEKKGLFIVCEVFDDTPISRDIRKQMEDEKLLSFSIGGIPIKKEHKCDDEKCWTEITKLYLAEVSSCEKGVNQESKAFILKQLAEERLLAEIAERISELEEAILGYTQ